MSSSLKKPESHRSYRLYGPDDLRSFGHRTRTKPLIFTNHHFEKRLKSQKKITLDNLNPSNYSRI